MKPRTPFFLTLAGILLWCAAYALWPERFPTFGNASPDEYAESLARGIAGLICFGVGLAILLPLAVTYLFRSLRRLTNLFVDIG